MSTSAVSNSEKTRARIIACADVDSTFQRAAEEFVRLAAEAISQRGQFVVALSGGSTPKRLYELLASPAWRERVQWSKVHFFWGDERFVPPDDSTNNYRMANEAMLKPLGIPASNIHRFMTETGSPGQVASAYEGEIRKVLGGDHFPAFDLVLLGLGTNAHTASLFPGCPSLHEQSRMVISDYVAEVKSDRLTFSAPLINAARHVVFLLTGADKAPVVRDVIFGDRNIEKMPSQLIRPTSGTLTWIMDSTAAAQLPADAVTR